MEISKDGDLRYIFGLIKDYIILRISYSTNPEMDFKAF